MDSIRRIVALCLRALGLGLLLAALPAAYFAYRANAAGDWEGFAVDFGVTLVVWGVVLTILLLMPGTVFGRK